jgi:hypothetical protein
MGLGINCANYQYCETMQTTDTWTVVQTAALLVAAVGAVFSVIVTIVSAVLSSRRDRLVWLRDMQSHANQEYVDAMHAFSDAVHSGPLDQALHTPDFLGLEEAWEHTSSQAANLSMAIRHLQSSGSWNVLIRALRFNAVSGRLLALAHPRLGVTNNAAMQQRARAIEEMTKMMASVEMAIRLEGRLDPRPNRKRAKKLVFGAFERKGFRFERGYETENDKLVDVFIGRVDEAAALAELQAWLVRDFTGHNLGSDFVADDPWVISQILTMNSNYSQPMRAVLVKVHGQPWRFAISSTVPASSREALYADALEIVRYGGHGGQPLHGGLFWIDGKVPGDQGEIVDAQIWPWQA